MGESIDADLYPVRRRAKAKRLIERLRERSDDQLCQDAARQMDRMREELFDLSNRIRQQRFALRENWQIIEARAAYKKAWYRSPLLTSILIRSTCINPQPWWRRYLRNIGWLRSRAT